MLKQVLVLIALATLVIALSAATQDTQQSKPAEPQKQQAQDQQQSPQQAEPPKEETKVPADAAKKANPVKPTADSIASGKKYYGYDCAFCHGENGDGKGSVAVDQHLNLKDLRDPATLKDKTDGEIFYLLKNGKGHMPLEPVRISQNELWNLINYVRSMSKSSAQ